MTTTADHTVLLRSVLDRYSHDPTVMLFLNSKVRMIRGEAHAMPGLGTGTPDIVGCVQGRFAFFEAKTGDAVPSKKQLLWMQTTRDRRGFACVFRSIEEFEAAVARCKAGESG